MLGLLINTPLGALSANPLLDPGWVGVGVSIFAIVISVVIAIWSFRKGRERKEISYLVLTDNPVLRVGEEVKSKIKIEFDGQKVSSTCYT